MAASMNSRIDSVQDQVSPTLSDVELEVEKKLHFSHHAGLRHTT